MSRSAIIAIALSAIVLITGTIGYRLIEGYELFEALYMSVITVTTVGFGEVRPLSEAGRWFTTFLIIIGFGSLAFAGQALIQSLFERAWRGASEARRMQERIARLDGHYIICGFGRVGAAAAEAFVRCGRPFVVIEVDAGRCTELVELGYLHIHGDAARESVLLAAGIKRARGLAALLESDPHNLHVTLTARELNPTLRITARAEELASEARILRAGADSVVSPYASAGRHVAADILEAHGAGAAPPVPASRPEPRWISVPDEMHGESPTIDQLAQRLGQRVVGLRRDGNDTILPNCSISRTARSSSRARIRSW